MPPFFAAPEIDICLTQIEDIAQSFAIVARGNADYPGILSLKEDLDPRRRTDGDIEPHAIQISIVGGSRIERIAGLRPPTDFRTQFQPLRQLFAFVRTDCFWSEAALRPGVRVCSVSSGDCVKPAAGTDIQADKAQRMAPHRFI